jgi:hypothetical protein
MPHLRLLRPVAWRVLPAGILCALAAALGCSQAQIDKNPPPHYVSPVVLDAAAPPGTYLAVERDTANVLAAAAADSPAAANRPLNVLAISGGGQFGSYAAGLLNAWTHRGDRPEFDVITGISSGALIAAVVYAGKKYDPLLAEMFTTLETGDVYRYRPVVVHILRDRALGTTDPLRQMLEETLTEEFMADMVAAHCSGRRLFVGTMNMLTRRPVIWDLGAIAASGRPDARARVIDILVATASISGQAPPVPIDVEVNGVCVREYHVDCGGVIQTFVRFGPEAPRPDPANPSAKWLAGSNLYMIGGGKLYKEILDRPPGVINAILSNISANLYALFRADAWRLYTLCTVSGMSFNLAVIPEWAYTGEKSTAFDPEIQRQLYAVGYDAMMNGGDPWRHTPPGYEPGEEDLPRAGFQFHVPGPTAAVPVVVGPPEPAAVPAAAASQTQPAPEPFGVRPVVRVRNLNLFEVPRL